MQNKWKGRVRSPKLIIGTILVLVALFGFQQEAIAGITGKIAGTVSDAETGEGLPMANIILIGTPMGAAADEDGDYYIVNISPGIYSLEARMMGYESVTKTGISVSVDHTIPVDFELRPVAVEVPGITITAERPVVKLDLTASERILTDEEMDRSWSRTLSEALETQTGVFQGHIRGGNQIELVYKLDNVSLNSGLLSDNYTGINISTIKEISVLTGGYNAEYGNVQSGIINLVTMEATRPGIHGTIITRMRPAGKYHFGRNFYSKENYDWKNFDLAYWTEESQNPISEYYGEDPAALLGQWRDQITPDDTLANYAERAEYETEATVYGSIGKLGFLLSSRYKRGVNVYPQPIPYNPEFNFQGKLSYKITKSIKIGVSGIYGGYTTCSQSPSNFNTIETSQEMAWNGLPQVTEAYQWNQYNVLDGWTSWPEERKVRNFSLNWEHALSPSTFYNVNVSYLYDMMDKTDREGFVPETDRPDTLWAFDNEEWGMLGIYQTRGYQKWDDKWDSKVYSISGDLTSQITKHHYVKTGFVVKSYDFSYYHVMSAYEGGMRWNLNNIFDGTPYEGGLYAQDKMEFGGLIVNAGVRVNFFNQNREAPKNMFDPLAFEETTPGNVTPGLPGNPEKEPTKLQVVVAPRLGISHPISENTALHFMYGHFYQRPSWNKMFGFPYINFTDDPEKVEDPYLPQETYMDQWMGFQGNPKMGYERTIQYEIGFDQNIADLLRVDITGYYKDASRQTVFREGNLYNPRWDDLDTWTTVYNQTNQYNIPIMVSNCAYADIRGLEIRLDTRFEFPLNFTLTYDLSFTSGGVVGYSSLYEGESGFDAPKGYAQMRKPWNRHHKFKGTANLNFPEGFGPTVAGFNPLGGINVNVYFETWNGEAYTYHGPGDTSTEPNNMRWKPHYQTNLRASKGIRILGFRPEISVEIRNLFNNKDLNMLYWDDLIYYHENSDLPLEERLPKHWLSDEPNDWEWYNMWTNPPRQVYFQLKVDF